MIVLGTEHDAMSPRYAAALLSAVVLTWAPLDGSIL